MKTILKSLVLAGSLLAGAAAIAGEQIAVLKVSGMTCASCPYIVKQTLASVDGVTDVQVSFAEKTARVTYDDSRTAVAVLTAATSGMGFPSSVEKQGDR